MGGIVFRMIERIKGSIENFGIYWRRYKGEYNKISALEAISLYLSTLKLIWIPERFRQQKKSRLKIQVEDYFSANLEAYEEVKKATYAWHNPRIINSHFFEESHFEDAHITSSYCRGEKCKRCGRTREEVRYDNLPYFCERSPDDMVKYTSKILNEESQKALSLIEKAKKEAPKYIQRRGMSGETLAFLHKTHGFTLEIVGSIVDIPEWAEKEYENEMDFEKDFSRSKINKKVVLAI